MRRGLEKLNDKGYNRKGISPRNMKLGFGRRVVLQPHVWNIPGCSRPPSDSGGCGGVRVVPEAPRPADITPRLRGGGAG